MVKIFRWLVLIVNGLLCFLFIGIANKKYHSRVFTKLQIDIHPTHGQQFVVHAEAYNHLLSNVSLVPNHTRFKDIKLKYLENIIKSHKFVRHCSISMNWEGVLRVSILPKRALARLVDDGGITGYIDELGGVMPLSDTYTPRVVLLSSKKFRTLPLSIHTCDQFGDDALLTFLHILEQSPFWKAQISHIRINNNNELVLSTQLTGHKVYFGKAEDIESKMEKLRWFYQAVLPYKGWDAYKKVTLKFNNQIVCE